MSTKYTIADRLTARLPNHAVQSVRVCIYIRHTLIVWVQFLWSRPQTTSHMVLVQPGGDQKIVRVREPK